MAKIVIFFHLGEVTYLFWGIQDITVIPAA